MHSYEERMFTYFNRSGIRRSYTCDFVIYNLGVGDIRIRGTIHAEIKPTYPSQEEIAKLCAVAQSNRGDRFIIIYGHAVSPRFDGGNVDVGGGGGGGKVTNFSRDSYMHRPHANGLRAMVFHGDGTFGSSMYEFVVDTSPDDGSRITMLDTIVHSDDLRWSDDKLMRAFRKAQIGGN